MDKLAMQAHRRFKLATSLQVYFANLFLAVFAYSLTLWRLDLKIIKL